MEQTLSLDIQNKQDNSRFWVEIYLMVCSLEWCKFRKNRDWCYVLCRTRNLCTNTFQKTMKYITICKKGTKNLPVRPFFQFFYCHNFTLTQVILANKLLRYVYLLSCVSISSSIICFMHWIGYAELVGLLILCNIQHITIFLDWLETRNTNTWILSQCICSIKYFYKGHILSLYE